MGKLVLKLPDGRTRDIPLDRERITIGRRADNDVCLPFPGVSGAHAAVVTILDDSFLEDLNSTNGTLVNGRPVAKHFLRDHDEIDIGRQVLVYVSGDFASPPGGAVGAVAAAEAKAGSKRAEAESPASAVSQPASALGRFVQSAGDAPREAPRAAEAPSSGRYVEGAEPALGADASTGSGRRVNTTPHAPELEIATVADHDGGVTEGMDSSAGLPALEVLEGAGAGRVVPIDREVFVIGRAGLQVASVLRTPDGLRLVHVEGDTAPRINGAALPEEGSLLALGDEIEIAGAKLRFHPGG